MQPDVLERVTRTLADRYQVERLIGEGGMATVYLAQDLKHERDVALKILRPELGAVLGTDRFLAEIKVTARLQHPNLLPLFDSGDAEGVLYYVMPFVDGESLRGRLDRERQLPVEDSIHIAAAVASALDYAHAHSIIHRDLKPENILLQSGQPLIADFGIALAVSKAGGARVTQTGLSLGTPQYMSPEQATGDRQIDRRTDIYSLGAVIYEMLAGEPPHSGGTVQAIVAKVLTERPAPVRAIRASVPEHVEIAIERALEKVPADRWQTAGEFSDALRGRTPVFAQTGQRSTTGRAAGAGRTLRSRMRDPIVLGSLALAVAAFAFAAWTSARPERGSLPSAVRFLLAPANEPMQPVMGTLDISPDGRTIAFITNVGGSNAIALRSLDSVAPRQLPPFASPSSPSFSPDGRWLAFLSGSTLQKVSVQGGPVIQIAEWARPNVSLYTARWTEVGIIVGSERGLYLVPAGGGEPRLFSPVDSTVREYVRAAPMMLPGNRAVLFTSGRQGEKGGWKLAAAMVPSGEYKVLDLSGEQAVGLIDGHLLFVQNTVLMAVPFDAKGLRVTGIPVPVLDRVQSLGQIALSLDGNLVYRSGSEAREPSLVSRDSVIPLMPAGIYSHLAYSPDGRRIAVSISDRDKTDIAVYDVQTRSLTRLTTDGAGNDRPEWTPDGTRIIYRSQRARREALWWQPADGSGSPAMLLAMPGGVQEGVLARDGNTLVFRTITRGTGRDVLYRLLRGDTATRAIAATNASESHIAVSPDGRLVAYQSNESGEVEVFVRRLDGSGAKWQVSSGGGSAPVWSRDGRKLFYSTGRTFVVLGISTSGGFTTISRDTLASSAYYRSPSHRSYDVTPDGNRVLALALAAGDTLPIVVLNWRAELREKLRK